MKDQLLTPEQVAEKLQMSVLTVTNYLRKGDLSGVKIGRVWRIRQEDLDAFLHARKNIK